MKLYHGTSETRAKNILRNGLRPRGKNALMHNWGHSVPSNPEAVYLTSTYPAYFAFNAVQDNERWAILEIDTDKLDLTKFAPDEDFMEQATRKAGMDDLPKEWSMKRRTQYYRRHALDRYAGLWRDSLKRMGTCAYYGRIPVEAITRVSYFDGAKNPNMAVTAVQAQISIMNYAFCAEDYQAVTRWMMGEDITPEEFDRGLRMQALFDQSGPDNQPSETMAKMMAGRREVVVEVLAGREALEVIDLQVQQNVGV